MLMKTEIFLGLIAFASLIVISYNVNAFAENDVMIEFNEDSYSSFDTAVIRVTDSSMDTTSNLDSVIVNVSSDSDLAGISLNLTETKNSTGVFEGTIFFTGDDFSSGHRLRILEGGEIYAMYKDFATEANITGIPSPFLGHKIELIDAPYAWGSDVHVSITAPKFNHDKNTIETLNEVNDQLKINTRNFEYSEYEFVETGPDTGVFATQISLKENPLPARYDGITVFFEIGEDQVISGSSAIIDSGNTSVEETPSPITDTTESDESRSNLAKTIEEDEKFSLHSRAGDTLYIHEKSVSFYVRLHVDYDEKLIDHTAHVWSDSDSEGYTASLAKNDFHNNLDGLIQFSTDSDSSDNKLKVKPGDKIFVKYEDSILSIVIDEYVPPLKQQKSGIASEQIVCKPDRANMQRPDGSVACMKFESTSHFVEKGWILMPGELFKGPTS